MVTQTEEQQAADFLKRAEIKTMRKDLSALREVDAVKERDKIARLKTLEEQLEDQKKTTEAARTAAEQEKSEMEEVLGQNESQEKIVEKDLKNYATEQERQQIFLLESQRFELEKRADAIDKEKDPAIKLEKNKILLEKRDAETKLNSILEQEKKLEDEEKFITEKSQTTTISSERKSLEQGKWDLDKKIQEIEKKRWAVEKQIQDLESKIKELAKTSEELVIEKNDLRNKILGADKSLRDIYSAVMAREGEKRKGEGQEQKAQKEALSKTRAEEKEIIQREQWAHSAPSLQMKGAQIPVPTKKKLTKTFETEEAQRKKFLENVQGMSVPSKK